MTGQKSVFYDLYAPDEAAIMEKRAKLFMGLETWLKSSGLSRQDMAARLCVDEGRLSDIENGKFASFTLDDVTALALRAGLATQSWQGEVSGDADDPFSTFEEWDGKADRKSYGDL
jgi:predicted XRE-type DNA-binding protein